MMKHDIVREATRLTRASQLGDATVLLQRMLRGEIAPAATMRTTNRIALPGREPTVIDGTANTIADTGRPDLARAASAQPLMHRALRDGIKERSNLGLPGVMKRAPLSTPDIVPQGARFIEGSYSNPAGSRVYKLFIPSCYQGQPLPLVVMLHGCTQSPDDFAAGTRMNFVAEEQTCLVAYPAQRSEANQAKCWNWFRGADQQRGKGEPSIIAGITRQIMRDYSVNPMRVYVAGLSAGGAAAAIMGATYPDLYAAIGVHSGLACGAASDLPSALAAMRQGGFAVPSRSDDRITHKRIVPTIVFHGDRDTTVHPGNGNEVVKQSIGTTGTQQTMRRGQVSEGHAYTCTIYGDANGREFLEHWKIHGAGHAWSGGNPAGSYTDPRGPNATTEMLRFFLEHSLP
jgi:poly(hydroxyalkanoate) depolymerase family esterase